MITLSEALSNFNGTTNYVAKYTPTGNVLGISQIFDDGTNVGIGTSSPTSKLQIAGTDSTSSNYGLKVQNSGGTNNFVVRNDGTTIINNSMFFNKLNQFQSLVAGDSIGTFNDNISIAAGIQTPSTNRFRLSYYGDTQWLTAIDIQNVIGDDVYGNLLFMPDGGNVGIGTSSPTSKLQIVGTDSTSSNYALKVDNSASSPLFYVRNDGNVGIGTTTPSAKLDVLTNSTDYVQLKIGNSNVNYTTGLELGTNVINKPTIYKIGSSATGIASDYYDKMVFLYATANNSLTTDFIFALSDNLSIGSTFRIVNDGGSLSNGFSRTIFGVYGGVTNNSVGIGMGSSIPTAKLQIIGSDSTSSNYALKIDNSTTNALFYVRNDGVILANNLPTSSAGLPSGAIWNNSGVLNIV
jgi:hypothetical protein